MNTTFSYPSYVSLNDIIVIVGLFLVIIDRFKRNLDADLATACLKFILNTHGDLIARPPKLPSSDAQQLEFESLGVHQHPENRPLALVESLLASKKTAHANLFGQITRSIALIDFMRNATSTLQM